MSDCRLVPGLAERGRILSYICGIESSRQRQRGVCEPLISAAQRADLAEEGRNGFRLHLQARTRRRCKQVKSSQEAKGLAGQHAQ